MYKLMVSQNYGMSYSKAKEANTVDELLPQAEKCDEEGLRWTIEDESGKPVKGCAIFEQIINMMQSVRAGENLT